MEPAVQTVAPLGPQYHRQRGQHLYDFVGGHRGLLKESW